MSVNEQFVCGKCLFSSLSSPTCSFRMTSCPDIEELMFRRIPFTQMAFAAVLGAAGGFYIYKPYFEPELKSPGEENHDVPRKKTKESE